MIGWSPGAVEFDWCRVSGAGGAAGCDTDRIAWFGPGDLEVVALRVAEVCRPAGEELRVDGLFCYAGAGGPHPLCQLVDLVGRIDLYADGEADAPTARLGFGVPVTGELGEREHGEDDAAKLEGHELTVVQDLRPAEFVVEAPEPGEIAGTESNQIGEGCGCVHGAEYPSGFRQRGHGPGPCRPRTASRAG